MLLETALTMDLTLGQIGQRMDMTANAVASNARRMGLGPHPATLRRAERKAQERAWQAGRAARRETRRLWFVNGIEGDRA